MASQNLRLLSLGFILIALCTHHCSARKALTEDLKKPEKSQPKPATMPEGSHGLGQNNDTTKMMSKQEDEIDLQSCGEGCVPQCFELPCPVIEGGVWVPTPAIEIRHAPHYEPTPPIPILTPQPPHEVPTPSDYVPQPPHFERIPVYGPTHCTPCEPWYGPGPCPCPCEEGADEKEGIKTESEPDNKAQEKGKMNGSPVLSSGEKTQKDADAPMPAMMDGSNVRA